MDLTTEDENGTPWDFHIPEQRRRARERAWKERPMLLTSSPMCTGFGAWQRINNKKRDPDVVRREHIQAMIHIRFAIGLYKIQDAAGRHFLHERPAQASSWGESVVMGIAWTKDVQLVVGDQRQFCAVDQDCSPSRNPPSS